DGLRPHGRCRGRHQGSEGHWNAVVPLSSRPVSSCDGRQAGLLYLPARWRYTTVPFETGAGAGTSVGAAHAALGAAQDVRHQLTHLAAEFYVWPQERIVFRHGRVFVEDAPERGVAFHELAARAVAALGHPIVGEMTTTAEELEVTAYCAQVA